MQVFQKVVDADGNESYVEVDLKAVELPEDHPLNVKYQQVKQETITRRHKIDDLKAQLAELEGQGETPKPTQPAAPPAPVVDVEKLTDAAAERAAKRLAEQQEAERQAAAARKKNIDQIVKEAGLSETFRPVIEAIPDLDAARAQAVYLAQQALSFGTAPSDGNGKRDTSSMLANADKLLGLTKDK